MTHMILEIQATYEALCESESGQEVQSDGGVTTVLARPESGSGANRPTPYIRSHVPNGIKSVNSSSSELRIELQVASNIVQRLERKGSSSF